MALNKRQNRSFWEKLNRGLFRQKKIRGIDKIFGDRASLNNFGDDFLQGKIGKITNQFGMNYAGGTIANRIMRYKQYEVMDATSPYAGNALDAWSANACMRDVLSGHRMLLESSDVELKEELEDLFYLTLNIDFNLPNWIRAVCKYGDMIIGFVIDEQGKQGITSYIVNTMHDVDIQPERSKDGHAIRYRYFVKREGVGANTSAFLAGPNEISTNSDNSKELRQDEMIHFSLKGDPVFEPFGRSVLEQARFVWSQCRLVEDSMLTYRVTRAAERKVFKIEVGGLPPEQLKQYLQQAMGEIKRIPIQDPETGQYNLQYNVLAIMEDYVFPYRNGFGSNVETLPGGQNTDAIQDVEYFRNLYRASLKVPKEYLEYDEAISTARGLAMMDARFAATVVYYQSMFESEFYKAAVIHLLAKGYSQERIDNFEIKLINPSTQEEKDRLEIIQMRTDIANNVLSGKITSKQWVAREIMDFDDAEIARINSQLRQEARETWEVSQLESTGIVPNPNEQAGAGGDMGMGGDEKGFSASLGGSGGGMGGDGGGDFSSGLGDLASGGGTEGGNSNDLGNQPVDLGLGGTGIDGGGTGATPETPTGGTQTAGMDPLRIVGDKILSKKDAQKGSKKTEGLNLSGMDIVQARVIRSRNADTVNRLESILKNLKKTRKG